MTDEYGQDQDLDDMGEVAPAAFKGDTVSPQGEVLTISRVVKRNMARENEAVDNKGVLLFEETANFLVLSSATNRNFLCDTWGTRPGEYVGRRICLYQVDTAYAGKPCKGVRIKLPDAAQEEPQAPAPPQATPELDSDGNEIPF